VGEWGRNLDPCDVFLNEGKIPIVVKIASVVTIHLVVFAYCVLLCPETSHAMTWVSTLNKKKKK